MKGLKNWYVGIWIPFGLFGLVCWLIWAGHGCHIPTWKKCPVVVKKKNPSLAEQAKAKAGAEYGCTKVKIETSTNKIVRMNVCGKLRWYDCWAGSCSEVRQKDAHTWARYKPKDTWAFTGCKELKGGTLIRKRCSFITNTFDCWVCKGGYRP